jgi:hypothetical protein
MNITNKESLPTVLILSERALGAADDPALIDTSHVMIGSRCNYNWNDNSNPQ